MRKHILVVDDDFALRALYQALLEMDGYSSDIAENGQTALTKIAHVPFDAVLLDYSMPGMTGLRVLQHLHQWYPSLPVVIMTGHTDIQMVAQSLEAGARACLYKPFNCQQFKEVVNSLFRSAECEHVAST